MKSFHPRPFKAAVWARGPHSQTLGARVLRTNRGPDFLRERLETEDGDFLHLDWAPETDADAPIVLVMHGLEGSASRSYVRNVCRELLGRGLRPAALNFRGCSGEPNLRPRFYHSGATEDPRFVVAMLRARYPGRQIGAMGFSLGGNVLLKMLGEDAAGGVGLIDAAVAMSVPYDLAAGCRLLERSRMGRAYTAYFLRSLSAKVEAKADALAPLLDISQARSAKTIWEFDEAVTAPLHGFSSAAHYYEVCSSVGYLQNIAVPALLLHAEDDPFLPADAIPRRQAEGNEHLTMALQSHGGHVGFLEGSPWKPRFWADEESARFLAAALCEKAL